MAKLIAYRNGQEFLTIELDPNRTYTAGRSDDNDIVLKEASGISRKHFSLSAPQGVWQIETHSKFGELTYRGSRVQSIVVEEDVSFSLGAFEFEIQLDQLPAESHKPYSTALATSSQSLSDSQLDRTMVGKFVIHPSVRILQNGKSQRLKLEGNLWIAGRDPSCEIVLADQHASRRQFSIAFVNSQYSITDLDSANGTYLNAELLPPSQAMPLRSGDVITVLNTQIYFELVNDDFKKDMALFHPQNKDVTSWDDTDDDEGELELEGLSNANNPFMAGHYPLPPPPLPAQPAGFDWRRNRIRIAIGLVAAIAVIAALMPTPNKSTPNKMTDPFSALSSEQKNQVRDSYELAKDLVHHRKWEMALAELEKVHKLVPSYKESKALQAEVQLANQLRNDQMALEKEQAAQEELKRKVVEVVETCRAQMKPASSSNDWKTCLNPALEFDPENEAAHKLIAEAENREVERERKTLARQDYARSVKSLESICARGHELMKSNSLLEARKAYQRCLNAGLPDPKGIKNEAKRNLSSIDGTIDRQLKEQLNAADSAFKKNDFKAAVAALKGAEKIGPDNSEYLDLAQKVDREANNKMKLLYSDSVLEESLGQIDSAKEKWMRILDIGMTDNEYYKRAKRKLQRYGVM